MADGSEDSNGVFQSCPDKVVLIGDCGVGKTSIYTRFSTGKFEPVGKEAEKQKTWTINDQEEVSITLFDTAGMERYMSTVPHTYFRSAGVLLLVYAINEVESFDSLNSWYGNALSAQMSSGLTPPIIAIVGNKLDLESERDVTQQRVKQFAELNDISFDMIFEVSALEDAYIKEMFDTIALKIHTDVAKRLNKASEGQNERKKTKSKCCS